MSISYFGRPEPDGHRRLGSDFDLLSKWIRAVTTLPLQSYPISQFSPEDQEKLFKKPACQFRLQPGPNNTMKLEIVDIEGERPSIDPELASMLRHPNYQQSQARHYELCCAIEDASAEADLIEAREFKKAKLEGLDTETAKARAKQAFNDHLDATSRAIRSKWKRTTPHNEGGEASILGTGPPTVSVLDFELERKVGTPAATKQFEHRLAKADTFEADIQKPQGTPELKGTTRLAAVLSPSPPHGSETTVNSVSSGSPQFLSDERSPASHSSSNSIDSVANQARRSHGGAVLDPLIRDGQQYAAITNQNVNSHLGSGLKQALLNGAFASNPTPCAGGQNTLVSNYTGDARSGSGFMGATSHRANTDSTILSVSYSTTSAMAISQSTAFGSLTGLHLHPLFEGEKQEVPFSPVEPATHTFPRAAVQPYSGITCYDVPFRGSNDTLVPEYWTTKEDKARYLLHKLHDLKVEDARLRTVPKTGTVASNPIHIFIDLSNIIIGFYDSLKMKRGISIQKRVNTPPFSFRSFDAILSRGRKVEKKVVAGSLGSSSKRRPEYMVQADELGYEMNIMQRVLKPVSPALRKKSKGSLRDLESATSGPETSGDDYFVGPMKNGEQGVDEILHLKILQSAIDNPNCGTIALATGDAAHAEYSDGFKRNIERTLAFGWNIELYGWSRNISLAWHDPEFLAKWGHQFRIIELDDFCEELFDVTIESLQR